MFRGIPHSRPTPALIMMIGKRGFHLLPPRRGQLGESSPKQAFSRNTMTKVALRNALRIDLRGSVWSIFEQE